MYVECTKRWEFFLKNSANHGDEAYIVHILLSLQHGLPLISNSTVSNFRMVKKTFLYDTTALNIIEKTQVDDHCDSIYECDSDKDGRNF